MKDSSLLEPAVIANLLGKDKKVIEEVAFSVGLRSDDFYDAKARKAYEVILECYREDLIPTPTILLAKAKRRITKDWLGEIVKEAPLLPEELSDRAELIIKLADERETKLALVGGLTAMDEGRDAKTVRSQVIESLSRTRGIRQLEAKTENIHAAIDRTDDQIRTTPTGLRWLDSWLRGGLKSGRFLAIAGPQGGRKSTLARNIILGVARDKRHQAREHVSIALLAYENDRVITYYDFVSMLAIEWLSETKQLGLVFKDREGQDMSVTEWLDAETIQTLYKKGNLEGASEVIQQAIRVGMLKTDQLPLAIYDQGEDTGDLIDRRAFHRTVRAHHFRYVKPDDHYIVVADYAQLIRQGPRLFEDMETLARDALRLTSQINCTLILLSQYNEDTNKEQTAGNKDYVRLKGGGDIRAGVQNLLLVEYNQKDTPTKLTVKSGKARRGKGSAAFTFTIEPVSGLILT